MDALGAHLLLELKECDAELLDDLAFVREVLMKAAVESGATVVGDVFHKFDPIGVTGIIAIAESHIGVHTWPEYSYAAADIFTCGQSLRPYRAAELIIQGFRCGEPTINEIKRGIVVPQTVTAELT